MVGDINVIWIKNGRCGNSVPISHSTSKPSVGAVEYKHFSASGDVINTPILSSAAPSFSYDKLRGHA
jgi:hypothetical protein